MAKGNMLLGQARGKVGSLVFSRSNGQQITRSRAEVVRNPKTTAQIMQRILLNTVSQAYSIMQPIVDHSFEGVQAGQKTMSKFMSENVKALRERIIAAINAGTDLDTVYDFVPIGSSRFAPNVFVIAKGTLPEITSTVVESSSVYSAQIEVSGNTYQDVINSLGLQRGDQLTFVQIVSPLGSGNYQFKYARVILDPIEDGESADLSTEFITDGEINAANPRNDGIIRYIAFDTDHLDVRLTAQNTDYIVASAVIASRKVDSAWKRSNASLALGSAVLSDAMSFAEAVTASDGSIDAISSLYLNNAASGSLANFLNGGSTVTPRISSVAVDGTAIAASGSTAISVNAAATIVIGTVNVSDTMYASYRIGSGSWAAPVVIANNQASFSGVSLVSGNVVSFAIGTGSTSGTFTPSRTYGGVATVVTPSLESVQVNGVSIASSGSTSIIPNASSSIVMSTVAADGLYASYRIGSGSWATPVAVSSDSASFSGVSLADGDVVTFAIGTGSTSGTFTPSATWGGTATVAEVAAEFSNVTFGGSNWSQDVTESSFASGRAVAGNWNGTSSKVLFVEGNYTAPASGDTYTNDDTRIYGSGDVSSEAFSFTLSKGYSGGTGEETYFWLVAVNVNSGQTGYVVDAAYGYKIIAGGM